MISTRNSGATGHGALHHMHDGAEKWRPPLRKMSKCVFPEKPHEISPRTEIPPEWVEEDYIPIRKPLSHYEESHTTIRDHPWTSRRQPSFDESIPTYSSISMRHDAGFPSPIAERSSDKQSVRHSTCTQSSVSTVFTEAREDQFDETEFDTSVSSSVPGAFPYTPNSPFNRVARDFSDTSILYPTVYTPPLPQQTRKGSLATSPRTPILVPKKSVPSFSPSEPAASPPPKAPLPPLPSYLERKTRPETPISATSRHRDGSGASSSRFRERSETPSCRRPETPLSISSVKLAAASHAINTSTMATVHATSKQNYDHDEGPSEFQIFLAQSSTTHNSRQLRTQNLPVLQLQIPQYPPTPCETPQTSKAHDDITSAYFSRVRSNSTSPANTNHTPRQHLAQPKLPSAQNYMFSQNKFPVNLKEQLHCGREQAHQQPTRPNTLARSQSDTNNSRSSQVPMTPLQSRFSIDTHNTYNASNTHPESGTATLSAPSLTSKMRSFLPFTRSTTPSQQTRDIKIGGRAITPISSSEPRLWPADAKNMSSHATHPALRESGSRIPQTNDNTDDRDQERGRSSWRWANIGKAVKRSLSTDRDGKRNVLHKHNRDRSLSRADQEGLARRGGAYGEAKDHTRGGGSVRVPSSEPREENRRRHSRVMPTSKALDRYNSNVEGHI